MDLKDLKLGIVRLPSDIEITLYLIREGLKARRLFEGLNKVGFDDSLFHSDFSDAVLRCAGFREDTDELYTWYWELLDKYAQKIEDDREGYTRAAFDIYMELLTAQRSLKNGKRPGL